MESKTAAQKVAKVIVLGFDGLVVLSLLLLWRWSSGWLSRVAIAFALFAFVLVSYKAYLQMWVRQTETEPQPSTGERMERRGSTLLGTVRDDEFERQLNWLREHKQLVKIIEGIGIAILALIALLFSLN